MNEEYITPSELDVLPLEYLPLVNIAMVVYQGKTYRLPPSYLKGDKGDIGDQGPAGNDGIDTYVYVAYASDSNGTGFSLTPSKQLKYRAEIHVNNEIASPQLSDFSGATWVRYIYLTDNVFNETPVGDVNGVNQDYSLSKAFSGGATRVFLNGIRQKLGTAYTEGVAEISFAQAPQNGDYIITDIVTDEDSISNEVPTGLINGTNTEFTLANTPAAKSTEVYLNGIRQKEGQHYTVSGAVISFNEAPYMGDYIIVDYNF